MTTRREFIFRSAAGLAGLASLAANPLGLSAFAAESTSGTLPIHQGWTTETETEIKVSRKKAVRHTYKVVSSTGQSLKVLILNEFCYNAETPEVIDHLHISGLKLGERYQLWVMDDEDVLDVRDFSALDLNKKSAQIAILSCMHDHPILWEAQKRIWPVVARSNPDLMLLIGDSTYADSGAKPNASEIWRRHCETRNRADLYRFQKLIPLIAMWDDHDFGWNNGDGTLPYKADSLKIFDGFFGYASKDRYYQNLKCSRFAYAFGLRIAMMDDRYFRTPRSVSNGTHWGDEQEDYLHEHLNKGTLPTLLCDGNQYFAGHPEEESYERDQPEALARALKRLSKVESPVLLCSGDVHFSEIRRLDPKLLGYQTWELTSSSVHSFDFPWEPNANGGPPRERMAWRHNFLLLKTQADPARPDRLDFQVECLGKTQKFFDYEQTLVRG